MYSSRSKSSRPAMLQQRPFQPFDLGAGVGQLGGDLDRDDADAVLVGVDQVAGRTSTPASLTGLPKSTSRT